MIPAFNILVRKRILFFSAKAFQANFACRDFSKGRHRVAVFAFNQRVGPSIELPGPQGG